MSNSSKSSIDHDVFLSVVPLTSKNRIYSFRDMFFCCGGYAIATWCYVQGALLSTTVGLLDAIITTFAGIFIGAVIIMFMTVIGSRFGVDLWIYERAIFGTLGASLIFIILGSANWLYLAVNTFVYSSSVQKLFAAVGITLPDGALPWIGLTCVFLGYIVALGGPNVVKASQNIMVPCLIGVAVLIIVLVSVKISWMDIFAVKPVDQIAGMYASNKQAVSYAFEWTAAFMVTWGYAIGSLPRLGKTESGTYWGGVLGLGGLMGVFIIVGSISGLAYSLLSGGVISQDPTELLLTIGGPVLGLLALVLIVFANVSTQILNCYVFGLATKVINPKWDYKKIITFWSIFCAALVIWGGAMTYYGTIVSVIGMLVGPFAVLTIVDFFMVRKSKIALDSLFQIRGANSYRYLFGFNPMAILAFIVGIIVYLLIYNPFTYEINHDFLFIFSPTLVSAFAAGLAYYLLSLVPILRKILLADQNSGEELTHRS